MASTYVTVPLVGTAVSLGNRTGRAASPVCTYSQVVVAPGSALRADAVELGLVELGLVEPELVETLDGCDVLLGPPGGGIWPHPAASRIAATIAARRRYDPATPHCGTGGVDRPRGTRIAPAYCLDATLTCAVGGSCVGCGSWSG